MNTITYFLISGSIRYLHLRTNPKVLLGIFGNATAIPPWFPKEDFKKVNLTTLKMTIQLYVIYLITFTE